VKKRDITSLSVVVCQALSSLMDVPHQSLVRSNARNPMCVSSLPWCHMLSILPPPPQNPKVFLRWSDYVMYLVAANRWGRPVPSSLALWKRWVLWERLKYWRMAGLKWLLRQVRCWRMWSLGIALLSMAHVWQWHASTQPPSL
jgi:hypothetical protein